MKGPIDNNVRLRFEGEKIEFKDESGSGKYSSLTVRLLKPTETQNAAIRHTRSMDNFDSGVYTHSAQTMLWGMMGIAGVFNWGASANCRFI
jgi:hypothetical protein